MSTGNRGNKRLKPNSTPLPNEVVCCLCRTKIDYEKQDPRRFFKHIREVHGLWPKKPEIEDESLPKPQMLCFIVNIRFRRFTGFSVVL